MNATAAALIVAAAFVWLGMVLAISFLETPLKFRAPGVSIPIGLGIGRLVFRALNLAEAALAVTVLAAVISGDAPDDVTVFAAVAAVLLAVQLGVIRPRLSRHSSQVLAGVELPRSRAHLSYVAFEVVKVLALTGLGVSVLQGAQW